MDTLRANQRERVLSRLMQGPASAIDLINAGGGTEATRRLRELRKDGIPIRMVKRDGVFVYRLDRA